MRKLYDGPHQHNMIEVPAEKLDMTSNPPDLVVMFLCAMFMPISIRAKALDRLFGQIKPGGAMIIFDKTPANPGYSGTVLWRLALTGKVSAGVDAKDIVAKEISLPGVLRPLSLDELPGVPAEFFKVR